LAVELAIFLFVLGVVFLLLEVIIPSGGLLTLLALSSFGLSVWRAAATEGAGAAWALGVIAPILTVAILYFGLKYIPRTRLGRGLVLYSPNDEGGEQAPTASQSSAVTAEGGTDQDRLLPLVGQEGVAQSYLRPVGIVLIDGRRIDCVTEGAMVDAGARVRIVAVEGNRVVVRRVKV
jgi:membrane-bound serine protease (ClpP class)